MRQFTVLLGGDTTDFLARSHEPTSRVWDVEHSVGLRLKV